MKFDSTLFVDIADALGLGNPAIVEKDYYVVQLLQHISALELEYHQIVFSGGTALAKSAIKTYRMSEDVDLKLVPKPAFSMLASRSAKRNARKEAKQLVESVIAKSIIFSIEKAATVLDEYRYFSFDIRYPQEYQQAPCLRPFIKLEFIESALLSAAESRSVQSIFAQMLKSDVEIKKLPCAAIIETQAEKLLSMMRRTASVARNSERDDDETLIRHVYDTYHIQLAQPSNIAQLGSLVARAIKTDVQRYGNQHSQMVQSPFNELRFGLQLLLDDPIFSERYNSYVSPMVYAANPVIWQDALAVFVKLSNDVLDYAEQQFDDPLSNISS
ncbi:nucleotidyl transferase AbiEii/AbiGii toxin family protein [Rheinheimera sp. WS51]|uniref:nucleotidyl transferase AbiEii/AbiGii toxin family protein n=1 Tax=Rheinheimera sp. WS51 TaxID=3425886 RepID=UPI003D8DD5FB